MERNPLTTEAAKDACRAAFKAYVEAQAACDAARKAYAEALDAVDAAASETTKARIELGKTFLKDPMG